MHELAFVFAGFAVGLIVGLTGVGGGSLMTPILIFFFGIKPHMAVGTDLLFAAFTKMGGTVSLAFFIWSAALFTRYRHTGYARPLLLYGAAALLLLAMYTKLTAGFLALAFAGTLLAERRAEALKDRHVWLAALIACIGLIPLLVLTMKFGQ
eukprot:gene46092-57473_t